jgi:hypothetical protein
VEQYNYDSAVKTAAEAERIAAQDLSDKQRVARETARYHAQLREQGAVKENAIALAKVGQRLSDGSLTALWRLSNGS